MACRAAAGPDITLKLILETGRLLEPDLITAAGNQSSDGHAAYVQINVAGNQGSTEGIASVDAVRHIVEQNPPPDGIRAYVTGPAALIADMNEAADKSMLMMMGVTGLVMTKLDGTARGGVLVPVAQASDSPIKLIGVGEKWDALEDFHPERIAGRILGMGDIVALVEEVQKGVDIAAAQKLAEKVKSGDGFDLNDFLMQISQMKKMGGLSGLVDKLPTQLTGGKTPQLGQADMDRAERDVRRMEGIICSMTREERRKPDLIERLCARAAGPHGHVAAVCVWPRLAAVARRCADCAAETAAWHLPPPL